MQLTKALISACILTSFALAGLAFAGEAPQRPDLDNLAALFAKRPFIHYVTISPDGGKLMIAAESEQDQTITFLEADSLEPIRVVEFDYRWRLGRATWISNESLVVSPFHQPMRRNFSMPSGLLALVHTDGKRPRILSSDLAGANRSSSAPGRVKDRFNATMLDGLPENSRRILVRTYDAVSTEFAELDLASGRLRNKVRGPHKRCQFSVNSEGQLRYCSVQDLGTDLAHIYRRNESGWEEIHVSEKQERIWMPSIPGPDGQPLVLADAGSAGTLSLFTLQSFLDGGDPLFSDPVYDFWGIKGNRQAGIYAIINPTPLPAYVYPDTQDPGARTLAEVHRSLTAAFPSRFVDFTSYDDANEKFVALVYGDTDPGTFYLYDRKASELRHLGERLPWMADRKLAKKTPFTFQTEDGLTLHGFLTKGLNVDARQAPSVVLVHGGPHGIFDTYHYDREVQFLAALGLNVIQVNYRGSGGYGQAFIESGYRQWSRLMVDDVVAGFKSLVGKEVGPDACIYGASYGAFNALSAAFRKPDAFLCASGHVGVYSLPEMFRSGDIPDTDEGLAYLNRALGEDRQVRKVDSPAFNAEKIKVPVFLSAGRDDFRAPERQTKIMATALKEAGKVVSEMYIDREGHGFASEEVEAERLQRLGNFLAQHLKTASE